MDSSSHASRKNFSKALLLKCFLESGRLKAKLPVAAMQGRDDGCHARLPTVVAADVKSRDGTDYRSATRLYTDYQEAPFAKEEVDAIKRIVLQEFPKLIEQTLPVVIPYAVELLDEAAALIAEKKIDVANLLQDPAWKDKWPAHTTSLGFMPNLYNGLKGLAAFQHMRPDFTGRYPATLVDISREAAALLKTPVAKSDDGKDSDIGLYDLWHKEIYQQKTAFTEAEARNVQNVVDRIPELRAAFKDFSAIENQAASVRSIASIKIETKDGKAFANYMDQVWETLATENSNGSTNAEHAKAALDKAKQAFIEGRFENT